jgi:hypothetical protein
MAIKATAATRAPRGTKTLTQAFFTAADGIPEAQRADVVKAALAAIRDQLKDDREKAKVAKAKTKAKAGKAPVASGGTAAAPSPKKQPVAASKGKRVKAKLKPGASAKILPETTSGADTV